MGILDYIFKSREQREKEKKEAEKKRDQELLNQAITLFKEEKYDECLKICLNLVNRNFFLFSSCVTQIAVDPIFD